jgi:hypothetical protein
VVEVTPHSHDEDWDCDCDEVDMRCVASVDYPGLYHGAMDIRLGPMAERMRTEVTFEFPATASVVTRVYLMCHYEALPQYCEGPLAVRPFETARHLHAGHERRP